VVVIVVDVVMVVIDVGVKAILEKTDNPTTMTTTTTVLLTTYNL
jgi:hypothetical protein